MGFDEFRRRRHRDMGMNVDGYALWSQLPSRPAMAARGGCTIFVPLIRHAYSFFTRRTRREGYRLKTKLEI